MTTNLPDHNEFFHPDRSTQTFASVVLPVALAGPFTYFIPEELVFKVEVGLRVEVQLGKRKRYAGLVLEVHRRTPEFTVKPILSVIDDTSIIHPQQVRLWQWMAQYYHCQLGEVMDAALPAFLKLSGEKRLTLSPVFDGDFQSLTDDAYLIAEALTIQKEITIEDVQKILQKKNIYPVINHLLERKVIFLYEDLKEKYKKKEIDFIRFAEPYRSQPEKLKEAFELCSRAMKQAEALMALTQLTRKEPVVRKFELMKKADVTGSVLKALEKKKIIEIFRSEVSRMSSYDKETTETPALSDQQTEALQEIKKGFDQKKPVLLHGVTGSGKTRVYIDLIQQTIDKGGQVLYLLPEVALTAQIISRLQRVFGDKIVVYHHRIHNHERVEIWKAVQSGKPIVLGARSAIFMPFQNLDLIVVDEEHDTSFKQSEPNPRYHGRDTAVYMAHLHEANILMGTATPSIESYFNAKKGKYHLVEMPERFGGIQMPKIELVNVAQEMKERKLQSHFTSALLDELKATLERGEQAILFQNRRGHSPALRCTSCGWQSECKYCDVTLTYHKFKNHLNCHYCGYTEPVRQECPSCGSLDITLKGFGTEKVEDELKIYLPDANIGRMDFDTVRSKNAASKLIQAFEEKRIDVLVGTKMVTKGLDFDNVGLVGVLSADQLLGFPDFRATEQGFQTITQVSGRAGRKKKQGKVLIQAFNTLHPVLTEVVNNDYAAFYRREIQERQEFQYPPYNRLIKITLKHKKPASVNNAAKLMAHLIQKELGSRMLGPAIPSVGRVRGLYLLDILLKLEKDARVLRWAKSVIANATRTVLKEKGLSTVRVVVDVDTV